MFFNLIRFFRKTEKLCVEPPELKLDKLFLKASTCIDAKTHFLNDSYFFNVIVIGIIEKDVLELHYDSYVENFYARHGDVSLSVFTSITNVDIFISRSNPQGRIACFSIPFFRVLEEINRGQGNVWLLINPGLVNQLLYSPLDLERI